MENEPGQLSKLAGILLMTQSFHVSFNNSQCRVSLLFPEITCGKMVGCLTVWLLVQLWGLCYYMNQTTFKEASASCPWTHSHCYKLNFVASSLQDVPVHLGEVCSRGSLHVCLCDLWLWSSSLWSSLPRQHFLFVVWAFRCFLGSSEIGRICIYVPLSYYKIFSKMIRKMHWYSKYGA